MGVAQGALKDLGSQGEITAEILRDSILENMGQIDAMFQTMPKTWSGMWQQMGTVASHAMQPAYDAINALVNSDGLQSLFATVESWLPTIGQLVADVINGIAGVMTILSDAFTFISDNFAVLNSIIDGVSSTLGTMTDAGYALFGAVTVLTGALVIHAVWLRACSAATAIWAGVTKGLSAAQSVLNLVLAMNPIMRIVLLVMTAIGAFTAWAVATNQLRNIFVSVFRSIGEACATTVNLVIKGINLFIDSINSASKAWNGSVFGRFHQFGTASRIEEVNVEAWGATGAQRGGSLYDSTVGNAMNYLDKAFNPKLADIETPAAGDIGGGNGLALPGSEEADGPAAKETASNTKAMLDAMGIMDEDLKFFRDVAEQESIDHYTTAAVEINLTNNNAISGDVDMDSYMTHLIDQVAEAAQAGGEKVHI